MQDAVNTDEYQSILLQELDDPECKNNRNDKCNNAACNAMNLRVKIFAVSGRNLLAESSKQNRSNYMSLSKDNQHS